MNLNLSHVYFFISGFAAGISATIIFLMIFAK